MDSQFVSSKCKATVISLLIAMAGLLSPKVAAQEAAPITEVQRLEDVTIYDSTVEQLEEVEDVTSTELPWSVGGSVNDNLDTESTSFNLNYRNYEFDYQATYFDYQATHDFFGLEVKVFTRGANWLDQNHGDGSRSSIAIAIVQF